MQLSVAIQRSFLPEQEILRRARQRLHALADPLARTQPKQGHGARIHRKDAAAAPINQPRGLQHALQQGGLSERCGGREGGKRQADQGHAASSELPSP